MSDGTATEPAANRTRPPGGPAMSDGTATEPAANEPVHPEVLR